MASCRLEVRGGPDTAGQVCERARVFTLAVSLGSVESLIEQPARMTHCTTGGTPVSVRDYLLRLSIGLEDCRRTDRRPRPGARRLTGDRL